MDCIRPVKQLGTVRREPLKPGLAVEFRLKWHGFCILFPLLMWHLKKVKYFSGKTGLLCYIPAPLNDEIIGRNPVSGRNCI